MARRPTPPGTGSRSGIGHIVDLVRSTVPPLHPAGVPFVAGSAAVAVLGRRHRWVRGLALAATAANAAFFRHPHRVPPSRPGVVVSPADGQVH